MSHYKPYSEYKDSGIEWLGDVPAHWEVTQLRRAAAFKNSNVDKKSRCDQRKIRLCNYTDVYYSEFIFDDQDFMVSTASHEEIDQFGLRPYDVIITKDSEDPTDIGIPTLVKEAGDDLVCGYHLTLIRSGVNTTQRFLHRFLQSGASRGYFFQECPGVTRYGLSQNAIGSLPIPVPSILEAVSICNHIDNETTRIDTLISKKTRFIELLKERRQALITQAVTKGLDPTMPMKDSGVEWLGEVPAHWTCKSYRYATRIYRGKFTHRPRNDPSLYDGNHPFIQTGDIARANEKITNYEQTLNDNGASVSQLFPKGTLVMAISANIGNTAVLGFEAYAPDSVVGFKPNSDVSLDFLRYSLNAAIQELEKTSTQNTQSNLNIERIGSVKAVFPDLNEQNNIAHHLTKETSRVDTLIYKTQHSIDLLKERRTALITAAVTGKIDLRSEVKSKHDMEVA